MVLSQAPKEKQEYIKKFYKENFGVDIDKYTNRELRIILHEIDAILDKQIKIETEKNQNLTKEIEIIKMNLDSLE